MCCTILRIFYKHLITPIYKAQIRKEEKKDFKMIPNITVIKGRWSLTLQFLLTNGLKLPSSNKLGVGSLRTSLLCIVRKIAGGWSEAVAVGVSDM